MSQTIHIRLYQESDLPQVEALEIQVNPYRPEDQAEVQAMFARAAEAKQQNDLRWMAPPTVSASYDAFWVAEQHMAKDNGVIVGTVAMHLFRAGVEMAPTHPLAQQWDGRNDVAELRRVRVAPEVQRQGVGTRLCQTAIEWARVQRYTLLVVNTTTPQVPALKLYRHLGFQDVSKSFIGKYELSWLALDL